MSALDMLVNIDVDDLARAESFYCETFGLRPGRRFGRYGLELLGGSSAIYLLARAGGTKASPASEQTRDYRRHWTPVHLDFVVPDLAAAARASVAAGAVPEGEIETHPWGKIAYMADPFGHGFCLIEFIGSGYDEISDRAER